MRDRATMNSNPGQTLFVAVMLKLTSSLINWFSLVTFGPAQYQEPRGLQTNETPPSFDTSTLITTGELHWPRNEFTKSFAVSGHARLHPIECERYYLRRRKHTSLTCQTCNHLRVITSSTYFPTTLYHLLFTSIRAIAYFESVCGYNAHRSLSEEGLNFRIMLCLFLLLCLAHPGYSTTLRASAFQDSCGAHCLLQKVLPSFG